MQARSQATKSPQLRLVGAGIQQQPHIITVDGGAAIGALQQVRAALQPRRDLRVIEHSAGGAIRYKDRRVGAAPCTRDTRLQC